MNRYRLIFSILTIILASSNGVKATDPWLKALDNTLQQIDHIRAERQHHIDSVGRLTYPTPYEWAMQMTNEYSSVSLDSAIMYAHRAINSSAGDAIKLTRAKMKLASLYNTSGVMYKEAYDIYQSLDRNSIMADSALFAYYSLGVQLNRNLAAHSLDPELKAEYLRRKVAYRDSALNLDPENDILLANRHIDSGDYQSAIAVLTARMPDGLLSREAAVKYNVLAQIYAEQGDVENQRKYLAQSANCDLSNGVAEYLSLQDLAMLLYEEGDYDRAYRYIHQSIEDATACNAKLRMLEMATILPIIDRAYENSQRKSRNTLYIFLVLIALLTVAIAVAATRLRRQNIKLEGANSEQRQLNDRLAISDQIKEEYIMRFMTLCLEYLAQMEGYRRQLLQIAAHKNFDELLNTIKSSRYIGQGVNDFYKKFDDAFIKLFPTFIDEFKALLKPDHILHIKNGELLNTELRIFALMRLGINDGESVCRFLRCSASTVYNYRAKYRSLALNRDTFEADIMTIGRP